MRRRARPVHSTQVPGEPTFLTTRQSAARLGVTTNAIKAWIRAEQLRALRTPGGHHRIDEADLLAFKARLAVTVRPRHAAPRVLVVDDEPEVLALLKEGLAEALPEAAVELASDGYEALVRVGAFRPDVLVLDLRMPRLDGLEVCRRLKAQPEGRSIRILAITGFPTAETRARVLEAGAEDLLEKPLDIVRFCERVRALLTEPARR